MSDENNKFSGIDKTQPHWEQNEKLPFHSKPRFEYTGAKYYSGDQALEAEERLYAMQEKQNLTREQSQKMLDHLELLKDIKDLGFSSEQHFMESTGYIDGEENNQYVDPSQGSIFGGDVGVDNPFATHEARVRTAVQDTPIKATGDENNPFTFDMDSPRYKSMYGESLPPQHIRTALRKANLAPIQPDDDLRRQALEAMPRQVAVDHQDMYNQYTTTVRDSSGQVESIMNIDDLSRSLAGRYSQLGMPPSSRNPDKPMSMAGLAVRIRNQLMERGESQLQSFGTDHMVSHMDALPLPSDLGIDAPTLNMAGGVYNPDWQEGMSADVLQADLDAGGRLHYQNQPSALATLTGQPYLGMNKAKYKPEQMSLLKEQQSIAVEARGILKATGIASGYDMSGYTGNDPKILSAIQKENRKISRGGAQGFDPADSTALKLPHRAYEEGSQFDQLARTFGLDEAREAVYGQGTTDPSDLDPITGKPYRQVDLGEASKELVTQAKIEAKRTSTYDKPSFSTWHPPSTGMTYDHLGERDWDIPMNQPKWGNRKYEYMVPNSEQRRAIKQREAGAESRNRHAFFNEYLEMKDARESDAWHIAQKFKPEKNPFAEDEDDWKNYVEPDVEEAPAPVRSEVFKGKKSTPSIVKGLAKTTYSIQGRQVDVPESSGYSSGTQNFTRADSAQVESIVGSKIPELTQLAKEREAQTVPQEFIESLGVNMNTAEQGTPEWLEARQGLLTSTGVKAALTGTGTYGGNFQDVVSQAVNQSKNPEAYSRVTNPNFKAGERGEELGKAWFEKEFGVNLYDAGLITNPQFPNQGTSVDSFIGNDQGISGLAEFKFAPNRMPNMQKEMQKHYFQMQHQMMLTGQDTNTLVQGYDIMGGTPQAGREENFRYMTDVMTRDPEFQTNFQKALEVSGGTLSKAVESGDQNAMRDAYLDAMKQLHPDGGYKGFTDAEKKEQKDEAQREKEEKASHREAQKKHREWEKQVHRKQAEERKKHQQHQQRITNAVGGVGAGLGAGILGGAGGVAQAGVGGLLNLARRHPAIAAITGVVGAVNAVEDGLDYVQENIGTAYDLGYDNTNQYNVSSARMQRLGLNQKQAEGNITNLKQAKAKASVGDMSGLISIVTNSRGLLSMEDVMNNEPEQLLQLMQGRADDMNLSQTERAGIGMITGIQGLGRTAGQTPDKFDFINEMWQDDVDELDTDNVRDTFNEVALSKSVKSERAFMTAQNTYGGDTAGSMVKSLSATTQLLTDTGTFFNRLSKALEEFGNVNVDVKVQGGTVADVKAQHGDHEAQGNVNVSEVE